MQTDEREVEPRGQEIFVDELRTVIAQVQAENTHEMEAGSGYLSK